MIEVAQDATFLNDLFNHPEVRPWVADMGEGKIDLSFVVKNHIALIGEHGATCYLKLDAGLYEVHTAVLPEGRGAWAKEFAANSVGWMFTATDAVQITTRVPHGHVAAKALTVATNFRHLFDTPAECRFRGELVPVGIYALWLQDWFLKAPGLEEDGLTFHEWLNRQVGKAAGDPHADDPVHNRVVAACLQMIANGRHRKALVLYNWHAVACRHTPVVIVNENPVQIKFDAGVLTFVDGAIRVEPVH